VLPDAVANQIAAGEVVERPASVVKELVENALDADAARVRIELTDGGKTSIVVSDDGSGMSRDDAILALDRHATSKITSAADLIGVSSFGFRGEALPAIASVSRFTLATSDGDGTATEIAVTGGRVDRVEPVARQRGTTVTVRSLFFNTPARRKFLRSVSSEGRAAWEAVSVLALAHPAAGFELAIDGTTRLVAEPGQAATDRVATVWGRDLAGTLIDVSYAVGSVRVEGLVQRPADAKPTGRRVQLFVNGRPFRDNFLIRAAEAGYRTAIAPGDRPSLLLHLDVPVQDVDVNVHPTKLEVRFRQRFQVERAIEEAVRDALGRLSASANLGGGAGTTSTWAGVGQPGASSGSGSEPPPDLLFADPTLGTMDPTGQPAEAGPTESRSRSFGSILQLFNTYLSFQVPDGIVIVDQHSAHERVLYEDTMAALTDGLASSQRLLLPITVELTDEELDQIETFGELLNRIGFEVEPFGGRTVVLQAVPAPHPRFDATACFREIVSDLARGRFGGWSNRLERFVATYACRAAVKAGTPLSEPEMRALLVRLFETELPPHDVHGRSTIVKLPLDELERRFGRR
jgi:DNA mismatch repair protein MutL